MDDVVHLEEKSVDGLSGVVDGSVYLPTRPLLHKRLVSRATIGHATVLDQWTDTIPRLRTRSVGALSVRDVAEGISMSA